MDAPGGAAVSRDEDLIADALLAVAVGAAAGLRARRLAEKALLILRCGDRSGTVHGLVERIDDLVHPGDHDDLARTEHDGSNAVSLAVDIHQFSRKADGIRARQEEIGREAVVGRLLPLGIRLHALAVDDAPRAVPQGLLQADLVSRARAAPANQRALGDQPQRSSKRRGPVRAVACIKMPGAKILQQELRALFIKQRNRFNRYPSVFLSFYRAGGENAREQIGTTGQQHIK